ncbi:transcriptional regulator [Aliikangiella sp. G2MR2-5]|uniref:winged helix-turn-helix domain-containing protein n=1 Tax=Aliikangiella sp. G2MR2-5 TaxID=2788943 RepID=UPI0018A94F58|nr:transcriptional regulator [Aliikangiella sp. G2MR2-5]
MKEHQFDSIIHAPNRLQICALIAPNSSVEFSVIKEQLNVSDSVLSKHVKTLEDAGYIQVEKKIANGRQRTWLSLTKAGRGAFDGHVAALREIVG